MWPRIRASCLVAVLGAIGCSRGRPATPIASERIATGAPSTEHAAAPPAAAAIPAAEPSPFYVVGASITSGLKLANPLTRCEIAGATFACGVGRLWRVVDRDFVNEPTLEKGLTRDDNGRIKGGIHQVLGRWPDDAWIVAGGHVPYSTVMLYRRRGDEWKLVTQWKREGIADAVEVVHWKKGRVVALVTTSMTEPGDRCRIETHGDGPTPSIRLLPPAGNKGTCAYRWPQLHVTAAGALVLAGTRPDSTPVHAVWAPGDAKPKVVDREYEPAATSTAPWRFLSAGTARPRIEHLSGEGTWVPVPLPPPPPFASPQAKPLVPTALWANGDEVWVRAAFRNADGDSPSPSVMRSGVALLALAPPTQSRQLE